MKSFTGVRSTVILVQPAGMICVVLCVYASLCNIFDFFLVHLYKFLFKNTLLVFYTVAVN